jgi:hypothetical protein
MVTVISPPIEIGGWESLSASVGSLARKEFAMRPDMGRLLIESGRRGDGGPKSCYDKIRRAGEDYENLSSHESMSRHRKQDGNNPGWMDGRTRTARSTSLWLLPTKAGKGLPWRSS